MNKYYWISYTELKQDESWTFKNAKSDKHPFDWLGYIKASNPNCVLINFQEISKEQYETLYL